MLTIPQYAFVAVILTCTFAGLFIGYWLGLRETERRLKRHQEVIDRLINAGISSSTAHRLTEHDDMIDSAALSGTVYPTYGGISRSASPFAAILGNDTNKVFSGGAGMQNSVTYSATPSKFASLLSRAGRSPTAAPRDGVKRKIYDDIKKAME